MDDLLETIHSDRPLEERYAELYRVLDRECIRLTEGLPAHYNNLYTRLLALCRLTQWPLAEIDHMRWRARQVALGRIVPDEQMWLQDATACRKALEHWGRAPFQPPRGEVNRNLPLGGAGRGALGASVRLVCASSKREGKEETIVRAHRSDVPGGEVVEVDCSANVQTRDAVQYLKEDVQFNAVDATIDENGRLLPQLIVLNPDNLVDVSALAGCFKSYGSSPFNNLLRRFEPSAESAAILLGHVANQMLDDCVNEPDATFRKSMQRAFSDHRLAFCVTEGIDKGFFSACEAQFEHIKTTVEDLRSLQRQLPGQQGTMETEIELEPSFFCETLGLQGRMDALTADCRMLVELKSGKWDEWRRREQHEHMLQMLLYKEILHYNLGLRRKDVAGFLFYSRYPHLVEQRSVREEVQEAMRVRNQLVALDDWICEGKAREFIQRLTPDHLRQNPATRDSFWLQWCLPGINKTLVPLQTMDALTADYFYTFLRFIAREHRMAKVGDNRPDSTRGMAALWNADKSLKQENGDMLTELSILQLVTDDEDAVTAVRLLLPKQTGGAPTFRIGDGVVLYGCDGSENDSVCHRQVLRCSVQECADDSVTLELRYRQRGRSFFQAFKRFAVEHDHLESTISGLYEGLFMLATAPEERRQLLLCQRQPSAAEDFQLIVGPPGTGKTSVTLRRIVNTLHDNGKRLLLMAYTNRAVDEICEMLEENGSEYLRIGRRQTCDERFRPRLMDEVLAQYARREEVVKRLLDTDIVVSTIASMSSHRQLFGLLKFDVAVMDEASQILEPQLLPLLCATAPDGQCAIGRFIMIGDHKQLPAVVVQNEREAAVEQESLRKIGLTNCRNSLFERLHRWVAPMAEELHAWEDGKGMVTLLDRQGRMHPEIADFASDSFYEGKLKPVQLPHQQEALAWKCYDVGDEWEALLATRRVAFVDVRKGEPEERQPKMHVPEAEAIVQIVKALVRLGKKNDVPLDLARQVGIIVPFRRQIALVKTMLEREGVEGCGNMLIDTVERYQGSQRDVIIYGTTITRPYELDLLCNTVDVSGVSVDRKLNVAVTRARKQLFVVGYKPLLMRNAVYAKLIDYCQ